MVSEADANAAVPPSRCQHHGAQIFHVHQEHQIHGIAYALQTVASARHVTQLQVGVHCGALRRLQQCFNVVRTLLSSFCSTTPSSVRCHSRR